MYSARSSYFIISFNLVSASSFVKNTVSPIADIAYIVYTKAFRSSFVTVEMETSPCISTLHFVHMASSMWYTGFSCLIFSGLISHTVFPSRAVVSHADLPSAFLPLVHSHILCFSSAFLISRRPSA